MFNDGMKSWADAFKTFNRLHSLVHFLAALLICNALNYFENRPLNH